MRIKICGITRIEDACICEKYGADSIGFIFYKGSKRYIEPETAGKIAGRLSPFISKVGVFVNETAANINLISKIAGLNAVQFHGEEEPDFIREINLPVIKSFRVKEDFDFEILKMYEGCGILLDSFSHEEYGGTGKTFDWNKIPQDMRKRIILAGGISPDNIDFIIKEINPAAVDVSSSLEISPGIKDENKIVKIMNRINMHRMNIC